MTVSYYDSYWWKNPNDYQNFTIPGIATSEDFNLDRTMSLITGTKTKVQCNGEDFNDWITTATYYDKKARIIQIVSDNPVTIEGSKITNKYSFDGKVLATVTSFKAYSNDFTYTENFRYDHRGRLLEHTIEGLPGQGNKVMFASNHYNFKGQLARTQVHSEFQGSGLSPFIQNIQYDYNIRGWLTSINDPSDTHTENDIFAMKMHYDDGISGVSNQPQFNGNIAGIEWATNRMNERFAYIYNYDANDRLKDGNFYNYTGANYSHDGSYDENGITYDKNGNILTLNRKADQTISIDQLNYSYLNNGNQIEKIIDPTFDVTDYIDYPGSSSSVPTYAYDANGNMIKSLDKGISTPILYSYLNKPAEINFGNGEKIQYIYDGTGNKIAKKVIDGSNVKEGSLIYLNNFVYDWRGNLQFFSTSDGRVVYEDKNLRFEYFMKDHLGNTRATYAKAAPGVPQVAEYTHYYPFGMQLEKLCYVSGADINNLHRYNGKELQTDYGLEWYDYGARFYDPSGVRFLTVDPMAEKYYSISPYVYCLNNPIRYIDPDGMDPIYGKNFWGNTKLIGDDGKEAGNAYLVKGSVKREVKSSTKEGKDYSGSLSESKNVMKVPTGGVMDDVVSSVDATLTSQKENGGSSNTGDANATKWDEGSPAEEVKDAEGNVVGAKASMNPFMIGGTQNIPTDASNVEFYWHTHPNTTVGGVSLGYSTPSDADKSFQGTMQSRGFGGNAFVIGTRSNTVTFYNKNKSLITIKYSDFKKIGGK